VIACWLTVACGSRSGLDRCAFGICAESATGGAPVAGNAGTGAVSAAGTGSFGGAIGGAGGTGGGAGLGGSAAGETGNGGEGGATEPEPPVVLLLIDGSFSMFGASVWTPTFDALMSAGGPIERYQDRVRFGFAGYRGPGQNAEDDPACAEITRVPFALENSESIREVYGSLQTLRGYWETPTGHAITRVTKDLAAESQEARKYILLFSDGAPDTCSTTKPQCGQDRAVFAVQEAFRAGVETRAIGIGYGREYDCSSDDSRCGKDHFQDLANAGRGLAVQAPPATYASLPCAAETGGVLLAEYATQGALAPFSWAQTPEEVRSAVDSMLAEIAAN
jgi:hypothetical protein